MRPPGRAPTRRRVGSRARGLRRGRSRRRRGTASATGRRGSPEPVPDREPGEDDADQRTPHVEGAAERRSEHTAGRDLDAEQHGAGEKHRCRKREPVDPCPAPIHRSRVDAVDTEPRARATPRLRRCRVGRRQPLERAIEARLARVAIGSREYAVGDAAADDEPADAVRTERVEAPSPVEPAARSRERKAFDPAPRERERRRVGCDRVRRRDRPVDPGGRVETRVASRERAGVRDRPPEWHDRRDERRDRQRSSASGEHGEHGHERQDVAVEVRVRGEQRQRVRGAEREQDQVGALAAAQGDDDRRRRPRERAGRASPRAAGRRRRASPDRSRSRASRPARAPGRGGSRPRRHRRGSRRTGS